jgi:nucleotide-binding universal stress UspA family protein
MVGPFIVVGLDGVEPSARALRWAVTEAYAHDARVVAVYAYSESAVGDVSMVPLDPMQYMDEARLAAEAWRDDALATSPYYPTVPVEVQVRLGPPGPSLVTAARGAHMLVVGSSGHHPLYRLVKGSVSRYCVGHSSCPVVAVPCERSAVPG